MSVQAPLFLSNALSIVSAAAPWVAAVFGIAAAVMAEQAFRESSQAEPPDLWRGSYSPFEDYDHAKEVEERSARDAARAKAGGFQSIATFFGAGAAIEAAAASQIGIVAAILVIIGIATATVPTIARYRRTKAEVAKSNAWYSGLKQTLSQRYGASPRRAVEKAEPARRWRWKPPFWRSRSRRGNG
jgi:hypothetical protein